MTPLGKCLVFSLKYPAEMKHLYWEAETDKQPDLREVADATRVLAMVPKVGDQACAEAAGFLKLCADQVEQHFGGFPDVEVTGRSKPATIRRKWFFRLRLRFKSLRRAWLRCGVSINENHAEVVPWLWGRGGRTLEQKVKDILGNRVHSLSDEGVVGTPGTVALARISIFSKGLQGFEVDRDPLVEQVVQVFTAIRAEEVEAIARATADGGSAEESADPDE